MNTISAHRIPIERDDYLQTGAPALRPSVFSPTVVRDADTDEPVMVCARFPGDLAAYRKALRLYPVGGATMRSGGIRNPSRVFGYTGRNAVIKRNSCRLCAGALSFPDLHDQICSAAGPLVSQLKDVAPERVEHDLALVRDKVLPDWVLHPDSWWTSGIVNITSPLPYHYDKNNFDAWSAMVVVRRGMRGGHLHVPEYDLVVDCRDGDVVFFNGQDLIHGVTPMTKIAYDGYRISAVYYPVAKMKNCLSPEEELANGRKSRQDDTPPAETDVAET